MRANANKLRISGAVVAGYGIPFVVVFYLGVREGGFAIPIYAEIGILAWWGVLVLAVAGRPALHRSDPVARTAIGTFAAFAAWTALAMLFSDSAGRTAIEAARVTTYLGVLALSVMLWRPGTGVRVLGGVAAAIAAIGGVALLSRLIPGLFGPNELIGEVVGIESRLAFPIEYWNGLAGLLAIGLPLILWGAASARTQFARSLAAAVAPLMILVIYLTYSRGGAIAAGLGAVLLLVLYPVRTALVPALLTSGLGGLVLIWAAKSRDGFTGGLDDQLAGEEGLEMLIICVLVAGVAAAAHFGIGRLIRDAWLWFPRVGRRRAVIATCVAALLLAGAGLAAGLPSSAADSFDEFREQADPGRDAERFSSASGNGRWQYWSAAARAGGDDLLTGIGPGTFEFYWEENGILPGYIVDAHSLYMEAFAELGVIGLGLVVLFTLLVLLAGIQRALTAAHAQRAMLAAAAGACLAFFVGAAIDWLWELPVIPIAALLCAGVVLAERVGGEADEFAREVTEVKRTPAQRALGLALVALVALVVIVPPYMAERARLDSQALRASGDPDAALDAAERSQSWLPFAAAARLQEAIVLGDRTDYAGQATLAKEAIEREPGNWQNWYVLAQARALQGLRGPTVRAFRQAHRLNRYSNLLDVPLTVTGGGKVRPGAVD